MKTDQEILDRVIEDANRTAEQISPHPFQWKVKILVLEAEVYDEASDSLVPTNRKIAYGSTADVVMW